MLEECIVPVSLVRELIGVVGVDFVLATAAKTLLLLLYNICAYVVVTIGSVTL